MVVLAGYKTVKEALVNHAEEFGERDKILLLDEFNKGHGECKSYSCIADALNCGHVVEV